MGDKRRPPRCRATWQQGVGVLGLLVLAACLHRSGDAAPVTLASRSTPSPPPPPPPPRPLETQLTGSPPPPPAPMPAPSPPPPFVRIRKRRGRRGLGRMSGEASQWREPLPPQGARVGDAVVAAEDADSGLEPQARRVLKDWLAEVKAKSVGRTTKVGSVR